MEYWHTVNFTKPNQENKYYEVKKIVQEAGIDANSQDYYYVKGQTVSLMLKNGCFQQEMIEKIIKVCGFELEEHIFETETVYKSNLANNIAFFHEKEGTPQNNEEIREFFVTFRKEVLESLKH